MTRHTIIIAEAGVNHNGSLDLAKKLVDAAADAGVDYVKFQTFKTENLVSHEAALAGYQAENLDGSNKSQYDMLKQLELSRDSHLELIDYCRSRGVKFLSTAFDLDSIEFLASLNLGVWKIPSGEITNYPYLRNIARHAAKNRDKVILSTGMCEIADISAAIGVLCDNGVEKSDITLLHCNTQYPTPMRDVNLLAMRSLGDEFGIRVGYSDHTEGIEMPIAAVALGATVIEKHITLDRSLPGPDQKASIEPHELVAMTRSIRNIELAIGTPGKHVTESERSNISAARKSIVAARTIVCGEILTEDNLAVKRPAGGISPMRWLEVIGTPATRDYQPDQQIEL